jgi:hypothetical protein
MGMAAKLDYERKMYVSGKDKRIYQVSTARAAECIGDATTSISQTAISNVLSQRLPILEMANWQSSNAANLAISYPVISPTLSYTS